MLKVLLKGGPTMIPLLICSVLSLAIIIERYYYFRKQDNNNFRLFKKIELLLSNGKVSKAKNEAKQANGPIAAMFLSGLENYGENRQTLKEYIQATGQDQVKAMEKRLRILDFIVTVAPLLGLLGTVIGIINSFNILAGAQGIAAPSALSMGIAEALISTATGLIVAIPSMLFYTYLDSKVEEKVNEMNQWSTKLIELLSEDNNDFKRSQSGNIRGERYVSQKY
ncbi:MULTISPECIES: MotA/TolQ/ExbB proton channel family protein [unclassified Candidatus Frackibacter]|uniref:MotA/TolQ/ExbB proton channel family protein n=1 Tax=unclassified Candidatus Frackibacter TaxID=2648818 RepID=UPI000797A58B|nr:MULTISPECIES: MotA/TolQ/ExbB proton channel family protein [unclassified Candidatus Frackibacter]KXS42395.1 MAG: biopolymer transport protein ExbB [Candidatus Frackibacter sp. T328-2]SDC51102.1 biopolymer transport protein ExbB [Candidatus Frackibacter sp. WG11]SEM40693.1 biopolymer transport protein ExbB [Candidatus Frackibacter sp. WG12]SFL75160.1 biopolymer transport protein ExbB [Candidatus Frackibacter sp. WG13]